MNARLVGVRGLAAFAVTAAMSSVTPVRADVSIWYESPTNFGFDITHVPDLDQLRAAAPEIPGLPDHGMLYCVPTASVNYMCYLANHNRPTLNPGPANWTNASMYNAATSLIVEMSTAMSTSSTIGTYPDDLIVGLSAWLEGHPFVLGDYRTAYSWTPTVETAMKEGMMGGFVLLSIGWYDESGGQVQRSGGHRINLVSGEFDGGTWQVGVRDPWSSDSLTVQSPFSTQSYAALNSQKTPSYGVARTMTKLVNYDTGYIDGLVAIHPTSVVSYFPDLNVLRMRYPLPPAGWQLEPVRDFVLPTQTPVQNLVRRPGGRILYLTEAVDGPGAVLQLDLLTGDVEELVLPIDAPLGMMQGRGGSMYFIDGFELVRLDVDHVPPFELHRIPLPAEVTAMDYDDVNDMVMLYSAPAHGLLRYPYHLDAAPQAWDLDEIPHEGPMSFCWNAFDQSGWFANASSTSLWRVTINPITQALDTEVVPVPGLGVAPERLAPGDAGRMYVVANGRVIELVPGEGGWVPPEERWFSEVVLGDGPVLFARNHSTRDGPWQVGPEWQNVPPAEVEPDENVIDCDADVDDSRVVDVSDLVAVILAWGQEGHLGFIREDINQDGVINVNDLVAVILAWGACA